MKLIMRIYQETVNANAANRHIEQIWFSLNDQNSKDAIQMLRPLDLFANGLENEIKSDI